MYILLYKWVLLQAIYPMQMKNLIHLRSEITTWHNYKYKSIGVTVHLLPPHNITQNPSTSA